MSENINDFDFIRIGIDREEVDTRNVVRLIQLMQLIEASNDHAKNRQGKIDLMFTGYDEDPRDIWEVPEIRRWFEDADREFPNWFYYMSVDPTSHGLYLYYVCACGAFAGDSVDQSKNSKLITLDPKLVERFYKRNFKHLNKKCRAHGISEEQIDHISKSIGIYLEVLRNN